MANYLDELNESQRQAVLYCEGPSLVVAGAGSGKTRVLTYKIAYLLEQGLEPWSILALTFTNKAAREMKERISRQVGAERARYLWMGTFHSIFSRILRMESSHIGFPSSFTIYDSSDSRSLIKAIIKEMQLDDKAYRPADIQNRISMAKNRLISPQEYEKDSRSFEQDQRDNIPFFREIFMRYYDRCRQAGAMDFDDLLYYTHELFAAHPEVLARYQQQFRYILVDEYQDTNYAQHRIVLQLAKGGKPVCVVGDDAQSIYSFRGAKIDNILQFSKLFPDTKVFKLEQNYRSTQTIVSAANSLIAKNREQIRKEVFSKNAKGELIEIYQAYSDVEEGAIIANKLSDLHRMQDSEYGEFAILYRTNAQSRIFEEALRKRSIPYRIYGGLSFYQRKEIKDLIAYFRLTVNPHDEEALKRIINYPARGIGGTTLSKIVASATAHKVSLWDVLCDPEANDLNINKGTWTKLQKFGELITGFIRAESQSDAYTLAEKIIKESGIMQEIYQDRSPENLSRQENIQELMNGIQIFCEGRREVGEEDRIAMGDFLSEVSLLTDQDTPEEEGISKVTLMTIHAAKGLEFRNVFVVGLEEELFPSAMAGNSPKAIEEERRLFYVAITRAEEYCFLSYAKSRFRFGKMEFSNPSRFLSDIDSCYLHLPQLQMFGGLGERDRCKEKEIVSDKEFSGHKPFKPFFPSSVENASLAQAASFSKESPLASHGRLRKISPSTAGNSAPPRGMATTFLEAGQHVEHERFGRGEVIRIEGEGENTKATIRFQNSGEKQLLLRFARIKVL